jgi:hypothetical protein
VPVRDAPVPGLAVGDVRDGEAEETRCPTGDTTGRSSISCSRVQIGQFWSSRLCRQKLGIGKSLGTGANYRRAQINEIRRVRRIPQVLAGSRSWYPRANDTEAVTCEDREL